MLASLVLHALVLFALPILKEAKRQIPARLTARLAAPERPEPIAQKLEPSPPQPRTAPNLPAIRPAPAAIASPQPLPAPPSVAVPVLSAEPAKQGGEPAATVPAAPAAAPAPVARLESQPGASGQDAGTVAQFRLELMDLARRYKRYPRVAQDNRWEGRVELRIAIGEDGAIAAITVKKGSGRVVLDDEAQAMLRTAKSKAAIPPALRGRAFVIEIPVDFALKDE